jgi:RNA polymerase sigma-32 factor
MQTTHQSVDGRKRYFNEMRRYRMLEPEEENVLAARWRERGDSADAQQLMTSHLRLVAKVAMRFRWYGVPIEDLVSEGSIGLIRAVNRFDPGRGVRLSTYARWWIRASIQDYILRSWSLVKMGTTANQRRLFFNLGREKSRISALQDGDLYADQVAAIANGLGVAEREVVEMNRRLAGDVSLNEPLNDDGDDGQRQDRLVDGNCDQEERVAMKQDREMQKRALVVGLAVLDERERQIFEARRLVKPPLRLEDLAQKFRISRERVRQIEVRAFQRVQKATRAEMASCVH